ncbi:hypothetical protein CASFOL_001284 [Castilleja foliolosa]|uniref:Uncharacterized protein n=1 Tax=Castilleja foliolosa TaxID=1961234 RepID=A0ABD3DCZ7_9LAMI
MAFTVSPPKATTPFRMVVAIGNILPLLDLATHSRSTAATTKFDLSSRC